MSEKSFNFSPSHLIAIHGRLFEGIFKFAGKLRDYDISKREWVLDGDTIMYGAAFELKMALDYDFDQERAFNYKHLGTEEIVKHITFFVSRLWQIHAFGEGNTRTTAVFTIKYLRSLGFNVNNDIFAENSWYFRNALVRANYNNLKKGIHENSEYLEKFFRNLLLGEHNELKNRYCHIRYGINNGMDSNEKLVDKQATVQKLVDKWSIKPSLAEKLVDILFFMQDKKAITTEQIVQQFGFPSTTAKRYLRELTEFGYLEASGGNKNRTYRLIQSQITK